MAALIDLIGRAASDPAFLARLQKDPFGAARAEGFDVTVDDARALLGIRDATDHQIVEALQARLSYASGAFKKPFDLTGSSGGGAAE